MNMLLLSIVVVLFAFIMGITVYIAGKRTSTTEDFMVAGRDTHPYIMAMSYGATFISTAAIVGFGGIAGQYGMGILWLVFCNILIGVFIAFVLFGKRTRKMGKNIGALTFPEFLSKRFDSKFLQYFSGLIIFLGMPLYAAVVLIGAARFVETTLLIDFQVALVGMAVIIAFYVIYGGIKGVMYTDAVQGTIMFFGMIFLAGFTYYTLGGVTTAHQSLTNIAYLVPESVRAVGCNGWTEFPTFGSQFWWYLVSTIIMGVGIGVLAQPQLVVRFMTVKSDKELHRGVLIGGVFILVITGAAYVTGALSNVYFLKETGQIAVEVAKNNIDSIIPIYINMAMPEWFTYLFMLTLLSAVMSTLSAQFHVQGTSLGRDIYETLFGKKEESSVLITRVGIFIAVLIALVLAFILPGSIVAQGTSLFMGICAAAFLPAFACSIFWKRATKAGIITGMVLGTCTSLFWLLFVYAKTAGGLGLVTLLTGQTSILAQPWCIMDPLVIAVPISLISTIIVSLCTKPPAKELIEKSFNGI